MKIAMVIVRTLLGLLFIASAAVVLFNLVTPPPMEGPMKTFNEGLASSRYFFPFLKITELVCGLLLVSGYFVPLALVILAPIVLNILLTHLFLAPEGTPIAIFLVAAMLFLAYYYRRAFSPLLTPTYE